MMEGLMTDSLHCFLVQKAINSCWEDYQSAAGACCWEDATRVMKVIALRQQVLFREEETRFSSDFSFRGGGIFSKGTWREWREKPGRTSGPEFSSCTFLGCCAQEFHCKVLALLLPVPPPPPSPPPHYSQQGSRTQVDYTN